MNPLNSVTRIDVTSSTIFRVLLILLGAWFLFLIRDIIGLLITGIILASLITPIADWLQNYRIPRVVSVALVYLVLLGLIAGAGALFVEPLVEQVQSLITAVPQIVAWLEKTFVFIPELQTDALVEQIQAALSRFGENLANVGLNIVQGTRTVLAGFISVIFVFILAFYLAAEKDSVKKFARLVTPEPHQAYVDQAITRVQRGLGRWLLAQLALSVLVGLVTGLGLWAIGIKYALILGVLAALLEIIPVIGPIIAAIPAVLVGFTQSWLLGLITLGFYVLVQQLEAHALIPLIMRRAIGLHPLVTIIAILLGARLAGFVGMLLAVPIATVLAILLSDIFAADEAADEELAA